uniref:Cytochrome c oxidase subunit 3 n=1 Tax=Pareas formosensis TaxID=1008428 RepID=A0A8A0Y037_9SAUR|nr:cytochrome c oxidase subunit III [Pareas formosensis]QSQ87109.1 cytochrome c oxidase subunit III [Pareas formosensis]
MTHQLHQYHLVDPSPWPLTGALGSLLMASGLGLWFHSNSTLLLKMGGITLMLTMIQWWRDVIRESTYQGHHTHGVQKNMRHGMVLFITSEVLFFLGFFWALYHVSLVPTPELGAEWPPTGINPLNPTEVPLLNTAVLLSSGATITWSHHTMMKNNKKESTYALMITIALGVYFTALQASEYMEAPFTISDSVYGSLFFVATGFHGLHVMIGTSFLMVCLMRLIKAHFTTTHHFGYEAAIWYWHFVDVVWLFLFVSVYWWGS